MDFTSNSPLFVQCLYKLYVFTSIAHLIKGLQYQKTAAIRRKAAKFQMKDSELIGL